MFNNVKIDIEYTGIGDKSSRRKTFILVDFPQKVAETHFRFPNEEKSHDLQLEGMKNFIPSNIIDNWTRLNFLLGLNLPGHTDALTEASNALDDLNKRCEIETEQQYRNAPDKFHTYQLGVLSKHLDEIVFNTRSNMASICCLLWINLHMKSKYPDHCKLITNNLK